MRPSTASIAGVLLVVCSACTSYVPDPLQPSIERAALTRRARETVEGRAATLVPLPEAWFPLSAAVSLDGGLTIAEANVLALFFGPDVLAARVEARIRGAELIRAGLLPNPELFLGPRLTTRDAGLIFPAYLSFEVPLGGRLDAERGRAAAELEVARQEVMEREIETLASVRRSFVRLAALRRKLDILRWVKKASDRVLQQTRQLLRAGEADQVSLGLAALGRAQAARDLAVMEVAWRKEKASLLATVGLLATADVEIALDKGLLDPPPLPAADPSVIVRHPRLRALEARYRAAERSLEAEVARQYPSLRLGPEFESDEGEPSIGLGIRLTLPIFDSNRGGIAVAEERRAGARSSWRAALIELTREEAVVRAELESATTLLEAHTRQILPLADATEQALETRLRGGQSTIVEVLATLAAIARARIQEVELRRRVAEGRLRVLLLSGHLFTAESEDDGTRRSEP